VNIASLLDKNKRQNLLLTEENMKLHNQKYRKKSEEEEEILFDNYSHDDE